MQVYNLYLYCHCPPCCQHCSLYFYCDYCPRYCGSYCHYCAWTRTSTLACFCINSSQNCFKAVNLSKKCSIFPSFQFLLKYGDGGFLCSLNTLGETANIFWFTFDLDIFLSEDLLLAVSGLGGVRWTLGPLSLSEINQSNLS